MRARCTGRLVSECIYTSCCNKVASSCSSFLSLSLSSFFTPFPLFPYRGCIYKREPRSYFPSSMLGENRNVPRSPLSLALTRSVRCWKRGRYAKTFHIRIFKYSTMHRFLTKIRGADTAFPSILSLPLSLPLLPPLYIRDRSQPRSPDILISEWSLPINYILYDAPW